MDRALSSEILDEPKTLQTKEHGTLILTLQRPNADTTEVTAWDPKQLQPVWTRTIRGDHFDDALRTYESSNDQTIVVVDLDGDGEEEWITSERDGPKGFSPFLEPISELMVYRGDNGEPLWKRPHRIPNIDGTIKQIGTVRDLDGDGWREIVTGTRFYNGNPKLGFRCYVDLVNGKNGESIWNRSVRMGSNQSSTWNPRLIHSTPLEESNLIAIETLQFQVDSRRPQSSTSFLELSHGHEIAFGMGLSSRSFSTEQWLEERIKEPPFVSLTEPPPTYSLHGWQYPAATLWQRLNSGFVTGSVGLTDDGNSDCRIRLASWLRLR